MSGQQRDKTIPLPHLDIVAGYSSQRLLDGFLIVREVPNAYLARLFGRHHTTIQCSRLAIGALIGESPIVLTPDERCLQIERQDVVP